MLKAIFLDYTGTMVREDDPYTYALLQHFLKNSDLKDPKEALAAVWGLIKKIEWEAYKDSFIKKDEMVDRILSYCQEYYHLTGDPEQLHEIWRNSWIHAPLFDDVKPFFERCRLPIYIVTNDDLCYVEASMKEKGLAPAGIISAESVKACKPHVEILKEALRVAGVKPGEALLIGDSESSDVNCARQAGITPVLLDRQNKHTRTDVTVIEGLPDFFALPEFK